MKQMISSVIAAGCLIFAIAAPQARGQGGMMYHGHSGDWMFERMDANHDGVVTKKEFDAYHDKWFSQMDANHDGKVTREEMDAFHQKFAARMRQRFQQRFEAADANHDGALTREEAKSMPFVSNNFDQIDANHDGKVTQDEIRAYHQRMQGQGGMMPGGMRYRGGMMQP